MNVVYVHRSLYLNILSANLSSPSSPVFFFAWDLDIVNFRYDLVRLDTSTVYYEQPSPHSAAARAQTDAAISMLSSSSFSSFASSSSSSSGGAARQKCDRLLHEVSPPPFLFLSRFYRFAIFFCRFSHFKMTLCDLVQVNEKTLFLFIADVTQLLLCYGGRVERILDDINSYEICW